MLKEFFITPHVFDIEHLTEFNHPLKTLLEIIESSGYILDLNNGTWARETRQNINNELQSQKLKDRFNNIYDFLKDRHRIVGHPKGTMQPKNEREWLLVAKELSLFRKIDTILATKIYDNSTLSLEQLEEINVSEKFGITGSEHYVKSEKELEKILLPFLSYAKKVTIIDPYFDISVPRFKKTLELIAQSFKEKRGTRSSGGSIIINLSIKVFSEKSDHYNHAKKDLGSILDKRVNDRYRVKWQNIINDIYKKYDHKVKIFIWDRKKDDTLKMHDRYIITDQAGISSAAGTDKDDYQLSEWGIKTYESSVDMLNKYKPSRDDTYDNSIYKLIYAIDSSGVDKK